MSLTAGPISQWMYIDSITNVQKGPFQEALLLRLLEKGVGVSGDTLVWKQGMENWVKMSTVIVKKKFDVYPPLVFMFFLLHDVCFQSRLNRSKTWPYF